MVSILGIIGNGLVIWIAGFRMKKTISSVWFLHLAIADLLCCASIPLSIVDVADISLHISHISANVHIPCIVITIMFPLNMSASVLLLTAMSIDRWVSVMWPFWAKVHRTQKRVRITAGIIWAMSLLMTCLALYGTAWCMYNVKNLEYSNNISLWMELFILFVIPFLIISTSYVTIFLKLRKSKRPQRSQRPYRIITAVILCFFICWAPYHIRPLIFVMGKNNELQVGVVDSISKFLAYLNSCINPIIYVFMGQDFRHSFLRSIPFIVERAIRDPPDDPCGEREDCEPAVNTDL
ncbi:C3a anaphylatoxin chemotactic receptor-like [Engystomops pustulosus]|uniref:C3a anaphylatoxin chemotactic receptor-like n=1 Tax=Engystomops pustulosus TaxID=76066 RepID=UPI003AFAA2E9